VNVAWVALDASDNDPVRFWRYVLSACQTFAPEVGAAARDLLQTAQEPPLEVLLTALINDLAQFSRRCVLVLEDYHLITAPPIHDAITFLLDHLPATLHLIMLTRSNPPLPLARLRARNEIVELRAADLRFTLAETRAFLQQTIPFPLPPDVVTRLAEQTEGSVAGLRLLALALRGREDQEGAEHYLATFSGSHRPILEYLVDDVFSAQPQPIQVFLLQTSILSRLTAPLCDAVTGRDDSASLLEQLERTNLFLVPLDDVGQWYRYHALFAEAMHQYARHRLGEDRLREAAHTASHWYELHGMLADAVEAALTAQAFGRAAILIERIIAPRLIQNEHYTLCEAPRHG